MENTVAPILAPQTIENLWMEMGFYVLHHPQKVGVPFARLVGKEAPLDYKNNLGLKVEQMYVHSASCCSDR